MTHDKILDKYKSPNVDIKLTEIRTGKRNYSTVMNLGTINDIVAYYDRVEEAEAGFKLVKDLDVFYQDYQDNSKCIDCKHDYEEFQM